MEGDWMVGIFSLPKWALPKGDADESFLLDFCLDEELVVAFEEDLLLTDNIRALGVVYNNERLDLLG